MDMTRTSSDIVTKRKLAVHRRDYVLRTRVVDFGEGGRVCAKNVLQVDYEGYGVSEIENLETGDVELMLYSDLQYVGHLGVVKTSYPSEPGISQLLMVPAAVPASFRRSGAAGPSTMNAFLAFTAIATSAMSAFGATLMQAAVVGVAISVILTALTQTLVKNSIARQRP